jgi:TRAP-type mannitol/chloroaromatic compound transport system permease large subunit
MAPFYPKGVAPRHVKLEQIFRGVMPFMCIVVVCMAVLYIWPEVALWLPSVLYG